MSEVDGKFLGLMAAGAVMVTALCWSAGTPAPVQPAPRKVRSVRVEENEDDGDDSDLSADDYVNRYFRAPENRVGRQYKRMTLNDGSSMSVQASDSAYSTPRQNRAKVYSKVEVGYPSRVFEEFLEYRDSPPATEEDPGPLKSVYGYVPVGTVNRAIANAGGVRGMAPSRRS